MTIKSKLKIRIRVILKWTNLQLNRNRKHLMIKKAVCIKSKIMKIEVDRMKGLHLRKTSMRQI